MSLERVVGVAGWQGSGKTTLLERVLPGLVAAGLSVVVVKHHGGDGELDLDVAGKDSDRLYKAGAEVIVEGASTRLTRGRRDASESLPARLAALELQHDLVLVEGYKNGPQGKVWLLRPGESAPPSEIGGVERVLAWDGDRSTVFAAFVRERLAAEWANAPRRAGVLVGGASRRMGRPKELLEVGGEPLLAKILRALAAAGPAALLGGAGRPTPVAEAEVGATVRLADVLGIHGPLAGILAALRWDRVGWTIASCDLPLVNADAIRWLLEQRRPGRWAVLPRVAGVVQPLLAVYEPQALASLEALAVEGAPGPSRLATHAHVATPEPPAELAPCWRGVNTPEELAAL